MERYHDKCGGYLECLGGFQYHRDIMSTLGDILSTLGDSMMHMGDIMSTVWVFSTAGGYNALLFEYLYGTKHPLQYS